MQSAPVEGLWATRDGTKRPIAELDETIGVAVSALDLYEQWTRFDEYPEFDETWSVCSGAATVCAGS